MQKSSNTSNIIRGLLLLGSLLSASTLNAQNQGVGWWRFDETTGQVIADSSGLGNNGFLGALPIADPADPAWLQPGRLGPSALNFFSQNLAEVQVNPALEPAAVSVQAWVQAPASPGAFRYIVGKGASACIAASYALYTGQDGGASFYVFNGSSYFLSPSAPASIVWDGNWHHLIGTYDGATIHLFIDGAEVATGTPAGGVQIAYNLPTSNDLLIGGYNPAGCSLPFLGNIDEVRIWNQALSPSTISVLATKACNFVSVGVKPATVSRGGLVTVSGQVQNCLATKQALVVEFDNTTPCTKSIMKSISVTLSANSTYAVSIPLSVPKGACTGAYSLTATTSISGVPVVMSSATLNVQ